MDDSTETHMPHYPQFSENVKHEFLDYIPPEIPKMDTVPTMLFEENSQSMSESTVSQSEIFSANFDNGSCEKLDVKNDNILKENDDLEKVTLDVGGSKDDNSAKKSSLLQKLENSNLNESSCVKSTSQESNSVLSTTSPGENLDIEQSLTQDQILKDESTCSYITESQNQSINQTQTFQESSIQDISQNMNESQNLNNAQTFINLQNLIESQNSQDLQNLHESQSDVLNDSGSTSEMSGLLLCEDSPIPTLDETIGTDEAANIELNRNEVTVLDDSTVVNSEEVVIEGTTLNQNSEPMEVDESIEKENTKEENEKND